MICRMCLVHFQEHIKIFEYQGLQLSIAAIIAKYFWFEPKVEDPVSNCICKSCWAQISNFHSYYSYIEEAQKKLSQTSFVKEEVAIDYDSEEGQTENVQDMVTIPSTSKLWYDEFIEEKGTASSSSSTPKIIDIRGGDSPSTLKGTMIDRAKPLGKRIFEEPFFSEIPNPDELNQHSISARCLICKDKVIRGQRNVTSNFITHLRNMHPDMYELYRSNKPIKNDNCSSSFEIYQDNKNTKRERSNEPCELYQNHKIPKYESYITSTELNDKIIAFIADAMLPLSIIENTYFRKIFTEFGVQIMRQEECNDRLIENFNVVMNRIKYALAKNKYLCTTVDVWTYNKKSFFGYACHWIDENFNRFSAALACKRYTGQYTFEMIINIILETNKDFGLNCQNIFTVTDNGSNFTHTYTRFEVGAVTEETEYKLINMPDDDVVVPDFVNFEDHPDFARFFPKHCKCASHALNLIPTVDFINDLKNNAPIYNKHIQSFMKCLQFWEKAATPKLKELISATLGTFIGYPLLTRWNSIFDGVNKILQNKEKLAELYDKLKIANFSQSELEYLEEYCLVMWPISECINFLQGDKSEYYGYLIPSLATIKVKLDRIASSGKLKFLNNELIALRGHLLRRFGHIFELREEAHDAVVASVTCPSVKFRWLNVLGKTSNKTLEDVKNIVLRYANRISRITQRNISQQEMEEQDLSYFDFGDEENSSSINLSSVEWELLSYSSDKDTDFRMLKKYPNLMKLFIKYNTVLPSSTPVEKLFPFSEIIHSPKRNLLSDENFEKIALLKANMIFREIN